MFCMIKLFFLGDEKMVKKSFLMALFVIAASEGSLSAQELFQKITVKKFIFVCKKKFTCNNKIRVLWVL